MVGVDRMDYVKGLPEKLRAFELFLEEHPECVGSVVFIQVAVPTREDVEKYQNLQALVNELVGRINGRFGQEALSHQRSMLSWNEMADSSQQDDSSTRQSISCTSRSHSQSC